MPNRTEEQSIAIRKWILAALKNGMNSPRRVQDWIAQNADIEAPSIPTIAGTMREEGYQPIGYIWEKKGK